MTTAPPRRRKARRSAAPAFAPPRAPSVADGPDPLADLDALVFGGSGPEPPTLRALRQPDAEASPRPTPPPASPRPSPPPHASPRPTLPPQASPHPSCSPALGGSPAPVRVPDVVGGGVRLVGVVTRAETLAAAVGGVAAELRRAGAAVVVTAACAPPAGSTPALPKATALTRRLRSLGLDATAGGVRCHVRLPDEPLAALAEAGRLVAAAGDAPVVVAASDRSEELDRLLARADRLVLALPAATDPGLATLAADSLARLGPPVDQLQVPTDLVGRTAATLGLRGLARFGSRDG